MRPLLDAVRRYLASERLTYGRGHTAAPSTAEYFDFRARGNCCCMFVKITVDEEQHRIDITVSGSPRSPHVRMADVTRLFELANCGDTFGKFCVDGSGAVHYATSAAVADIDLDEEAITFAVRVAGVRFDRLYPGLIQVINYDADPDKLWPVIERPDWGRINNEYNALACRPEWGPPDDYPTPHGILQLTDFADASHTSAVLADKPCGGANGIHHIASTNGGIV